MDASYELISAAIAKLRATPAVTNYVSTRIYDRVPGSQNGSENVPFPYISLGPSSSVPDDYECVDGEEITFQFDVWSSGCGEAFSTVECRKISGAIKRALHNAELTLSTNALVTLRHTLTRVMADPDPTISHAAVQFTAVVETP